MVASPDRLALVPLFSKWIRQVCEGEPESILDVGCGFLQPNFKAVFGFRYYGLNPPWIYTFCDYHGLAEILPFKDNRFQLVTAFSVVEHLHCPFEAVAEMLRVAQKAVLLTTDFTEGDKNRDVSHMYSWTPVTFKHFLEAHRPNVSVNVESNIMVGVVKK